MSKRLEEAAIKWWKTKRPEGLTLKDHAANPAIGAWNSVEEIALAVEVARLVRSRIKRGRRGRCQEK